MIDVSVIVSVADRLARGLRSAETRVAKSAERMHKRLQLAANLSLVGEGAERVANRVRAGLGGMVDAAVEFESAMADVKKVVTFDTPDGFDRFGDQIMAMSREIPIAAEGLAAIAAAGGQLGIEAKSLPNFVDTVARMSTAFDMLPDQAGEAMAKLSNVYQIPIGEMEDLGDAINHLSDNTAAKASDIVRALGRIGGTAKQFGLAATEAAALADAFIALGKPPEVAGTAINAMLLKMQTATKQNKKFQAGLKDLGISAEDLEEAIAEDAQGALLQFLETLENVDARDRAGVLSDLFGLEYSDDISLLVGSLDEYRKALGHVGDETVYAGSMSREFANRASTTANAFILFQNRVTELKESIGSALLPALKSLTERMGGVVEKVTAWVRENPELTTTIVTLVAAIGGIAAVMAPVFMASSAIIGAWGTMAFGATKLIASVGSMITILGKVGWAARAVGAVFMANPVIAIAAGIAVAAYLIWDNWEPIKAFFADLWESVKTAASAAWEGIKTIFLTYTPHGLIITHWETISATFDTIWAAVTTGLSTAWEGIKTLFLNYTPHGLIITHWDTISATFDAIWARVSTGVTAAWEGIKTAFLNYTPHGLIITHWDGIAETFRGLGAAVLDGLVAGLEAGVQAVVDTVTGISDSIVSTFKGILGIASPSRVFMEFGQYLMDGLVAGLQAGIQAVVDTVAGISESVVSTFRGILGIASPSKVFKEFGGYLMDGLITGLKAKIAAVKEAISGIGSSVVGWFRDKLGIRSPSRVFMGLGGHLSEGLAIGIRQREGDVIASMARIRQSVAGPLAAGVALTGGAAAATAGPGGLAGGAVYSPVYNITISAGGAEGADVEAAIRRALEDHDRRARGEMRRLLHD